MSKLSKLMLGSFLGPFFVTFFLTLFIFVLQFFWKYIDDLMGKGVEFSLILELIYYVSLTILPMSLPLAILLAAIMTLGNLGDRNELTALKSAGLSLERIIRPISLLIIVISILAFFFINNVFPYANLKFSSLIWDLTEKKPALNIKEKVFYKEIEGFTIRVNSKDLDTDFLYDLLIYDHSENATKRNKKGKIIIAKAGKMYMNSSSNEMILELYDGKIYENAYGQQYSLNHPHLLYEFASLEKRFDLSSFDLKRTKEEQFDSYFEMMSLKQLHKVNDSLIQKKLKFDDNQVDYYLSRFEAFNPKNSKEQKDSLKPAKAGLNFEALTSKQQIQAYQNALTFARSAKENNKNVNQNTQINFHKNFSDINMEVHRKFSFAFSCIILFLVGASTGAYFKKGGLGIPVLISVVFFLVHFVTNTIAEALIKSLTLSPILGMWLSNLIFTPVALYMFYVSMNEYPILKPKFHWFKKKK